MTSAATVPIAEFDVGPLTWVRGEIDQALSRAQADLAALRAAPPDRAALERSAANVHQATGAIVMVGLDAVVPFGEEIERSIAALAAADAATLGARCDAIDRACRKLKVFLREIEEGVPLVALKLFPEYEAMQRLRGVEFPAASDLFHPDLSLGTAPLRTIGGAGGMPR